MPTAIPTLHYMVDPILKDSASKVLHLIRFFFYNPGFVTSTFREKELSFRGIATRYPDDPQKVVDHVMRVLGDAISRVVPEIPLTPNVSFKMLDANNYTLIVNITDPAGNSFIPDGMVEVNNNEIKISFKGV